MRAHTEVTPPPLLLLPAGAGLACCLHHGARMRACWLAGASEPVPGIATGPPFRACTADSLTLLLPALRPWGGQPAGRQRALPHLKTYLRHSEDGSEVAW